MEVDHLQIALDSMNKLQMAMMMKTKIHFTDLFEDCVLKIFEYLSNYEIMAMGLTNKHFHYIASAELKKRELTRFERTILDERKFSARWFPSVLTMRNVYKILCSVGSSLTSISIGQSAFQKQERHKSSVEKRGIFKLDYILELINDYCDVDQLDSLTLDGFNVSQNILNFTRVWSNVKTLRFQRCSFHFTEDEMRQLLKMLERISFLEIGINDDIIHHAEKNHFTGSCLFQVPPTVTDLYLTKWNYLELRNLQWFLEINEQLRHVSFSGNAMSSIVNVEILLLGRLHHNKKLKTLEDRLRPINLDYIGRKQERKFLVPLPTNERMYDQLGFSLLRADSNEYQIRRTTFLPTNCLGLSIIQKVDIMKFRLLGLKPPSLDKLVPFLFQTPFAKLFSYYYITDESPNYLLRLERKVKAIDDRIKRRRVRAKRTNF